MVKMRPQQLPKDTVASVFYIGYIYPIKMINFSVSMINKAYCTGGPTDGQPYAPTYRDEGSIYKHSSNRATLNHAENSHRTATGNGKRISGAEFGKSVKNNKCII